MRRALLIAVAAACVLHSAGANASTARPAVPLVVPHLATREDAALDDKLEDLGENFDGWAAIFVQDLKTGRFARWNSDARFPAASLVKVGVIAEGIRRFGYGPSSPIDRDLQQIGEWSSNLAANRIFKLIGGVAPTAAALQRLGMFSSTYPYAYRLNTSVGDAPKPPPQLHSRVTTARDLGRALFRLQATAAGQRWAMKETELSAAQGRAALEYLGLATPATSLLTYPAGSRHSEKDGWLDDVRGSAAIVYLKKRAEIVVVLTYKPHISLSAARELGARVSKLAFAG